MTATRTAVVVLLLCSLGTPGWAGDLKLSLQDGRVTLAAHGVTVRQILEEWARIGQSRVINVDKLRGGLVTLDLVDVPERQALDVILRSVPGYMAARRSAPAPGASQFDPILLLVSSAPVAPSPSGLAGAPKQQPGRPQPFQPPVAADPDFAVEEKEEEPPGDIQPEEPPAANPGVQGPPRPDFTDPRRMMRQRMLQEMGTDPSVTSGFPPAEASDPGSVVPPTTPGVPAQTAPRPGMVIAPSEGEKATPIAPPGMPVAPPGVRPKIP